LGEDRGEGNLFHKRSALSLLPDQRSSGSELHFDFDLLEAKTAAHQHLAAEVDILVIFEVQAELVVQVDAAFDNLAAAVAFYLEDVISLFRLGGFAAE
jgi:hypothetical protein